MWRRPLRLAECKALHLLAGLGAEQQDLRRQDPLVTNTPLWQPSFCAPAACCRKRWTDRHGAGRLLQAALGAHWQGQGGHRHGTQDRSPVLQRRASWNGVRRPRCIVLRDALPHTGSEQSASACQGIRICSPAHGADTWRRRFLGIILQRQLSELRVQRLQINGDFWPNTRRGPEHPGSPFKQLRFPLCDLIGMDVELLRQFCQRLIALDGGQSHLRLEYRCVVPARSSAHCLSCSRSSSPLSGRNSTYPAVQICRASSEGSIVVADDVCWRRVPGECLGNLACQPLCRRMPGHRKPQQLPPPVAENKKCEELLKGNRWNYKEINRRDPVSVVVQEGLPCLQGATSPRYHVLRDY